MSGSQAATAWLYLVVVWIKRGGSIRDFPLLSEEQKKFVEEALKDA